ncbi:MAG: hypothetical protein EAX91_00805 [Candidatus Lokiarchaeota archaeon]|nr:hypothetical protein [Candidatus Lokiarchaeota archaeon]
MNMNCIHRGINLLRIFRDDLTSPKFCPSYEVEIPPEEPKEIMNKWIYRLALAFILIIILGILFWVIQGIIKYYYRVFY